MVVLLVGAGAVAGGEERSQDSIAWQANYRKAQQRRVDEKRPMLVFVMSDYCSHCHRMMASTYVEPSVVQDVRGAFIPTLVNASQNAGLATAFQVKVYPTTFVVDADNRIVDRIEGYADADTIRKRIALFAQSNRLAKKPR